MMSSVEETYDEAMHRFSQEDYDGAIVLLEQILALHPAHFEAQLALGMAFSRKGDQARAILEGHKAEKLRPRDMLVHTNLSLFYVKTGNRAAAEHHGLQAKIASWQGNMGAPKAKTAEEKELAVVTPKPPPPPMPEKFPEMPWKKKKPAGAEPPPGGGSAG